MHDLRSVSGREARPKRFELLRPLALAVSLVLLAAACGGGRDEKKTAQTTGGTPTTGGAEPIIDASACPGDPTTGISGNTIKLGTSLPQSGLYAAFAEILKGSQAYFEYLNKDLGGVEIAGTKYQIELVDKDDAYQAEKTVNNVNAFINDDQVFALFNVVGTKNNLAVRDIVNEQCVPSLFAATGSPAWGNADYPWVLGTELVPYPLEAKAFFDYLQENKPDAKVAILRASDDFGRAYSDTLAELVKGSNITIVKEETYNPEQFDTKSQVTSLAATDADVFFLGATLLGCPDALNNMAAAGWKPLVYMSGTCTSKTLIGMAGDAADGVMSVAPLMDPANPTYDSNDNMKLYKKKVKQYAPEAEADNGIVAYGWTTAAMLAETLSRSPALDRVSVMETARTLDSVQGIALLLPDAALTTSADDWFLGENFQLVQYSLDKGYFEPLGTMVSFEGQTADFTPEDLLNG